MANARHDYWIFVGLTRQGWVHKRTLLPAQEFFEKEFGCGIGDDIDRQGDGRESVLGDRDIQRRLMNGVSGVSSSSLRDPFATICLRCFVSNAIHRTCVAKVAKFGQRHDFSVEDILPLVLDPLPLKGDEISFASLDAKNSLTTKILESFDPTQSNLSTWTTRRVTRDRELKRFLLEQGVEEVSDWMILNERRPGSLKGILKEVCPLIPIAGEVNVSQSNSALGHDGGLTAIEIETYVALLTAYHRAYRDPIRELRRQKGVRKQQRYPQPTQEQLEAIARLLRESKTLTPEAVLAQLRSLAKLLRQYRIQVYGKGRGRPSRDPPSLEGNDNLSEAIQPYLQKCLTEALSIVIEGRVQYLAGKKASQAQQFLVGLELFHYQGMATGEIATEWGWTQSKVSRFLALKQLRADVRRETFGLLKAQVMQLDSVTRSTDELMAADQRLAELLDPPLDEMIRDAEREAITSRNRQMNSLFSQTLGRVLQARKEK